jgi:hypothetical protein
VSPMERRYLRSIRQLSLIAVTDTGTVHQATEY